MSWSRCTAAVLALFISFARPCSCCKVGTPARRNAREIHEGYMWDTYGINAGYMRDTCGIHVSAEVRGYMRDTCGILPRYRLGYMYFKCILRGTYLRCRIHAGYKQDTCICKGNQDTCGIHPRYMMIRYMYLKFIQARDTSRPQVGLEIRILECIPMYPTCIVSVSCVSCI